MCQKIVDLVNSAVDDLAPACGDRPVRPCNEFPNSAYGHLVRLSVEDKRTSWRFVTVLEFTELWVKDRARYAENRCACGCMTAENKATVVLAKTPRGERWRPVDELDPRKPGYIPTAKS